MLNGEVLDVWPAQLGSRAGSARLLRFLALFRFLLCIQFRLNLTMWHAHELPRQIFKIGVLIRLCFHD